MVRIYARNFLLLLFCMICIIMLDVVHGATRLELWNAHSHTYKALLWKNWMKEHGKYFESQTEEHDIRLEIFLQNCEKISKLNDQHYPTTKFALNKYADMNFTEFSRLKLSKFQKVKEEEYERKGEFDDLQHSRYFPQSVDWERRGFVSPITDQGDCGGCYAFSAVTAIESRCAIAKQRPVEVLSKQQIIDCSWDQGNTGCTGGTMEDVFEFVLSEGGVCRERDYIYEEHDQKCRQSSNCEHVDKLMIYRNIRPRSEKRLAYHVSKGPISIGVEASFGFQFYSSGIFSGECGDELDHAVSIVGYGEENGQKYWKIKNFWGPEWGEKGYIRICRECKSWSLYGQCGVTRLASFPLCSRQ